MKLKTLPNNEFLKNVSTRSWLWHSAIIVDKWFAIIIDKRLRFPSKISILVFFHDFWFLSKMFNWFHSEVFILLSFQSFCFSFQLEWSKEEVEPLFPSVVSYQKSTVMFSYINSSYYGWLATPSSIGKKSKFDLYRKRLLHKMIHVPWNTGFFKSSP